MSLLFRSRSALTGLLLAAGLAACGGGDGTGPDGDGDGDGGTGTLLTSGTPLTGRSGGEGDETVYRIVVPTGATLLTVTTTGGTGDLDLYVRRDQVPTESTYDCQSSGGDNTESCELDSPAAGTWYIMLQGFEAYSGVTLVATVTGGGGGGGGGTNDYALSVSPASATLARGGSTSLTVTAARSGYAGAIALSATGLPSGVTAGAATIADGATSGTLTLTATSSAALGTATITVKGVASGLTDRTATSSLTVGAAGGTGGTAVTWRSVSTGYTHTCGVTTANAGYCWGANYNFEVGSTQPSTGGTYKAPALVAGGHQWAQIVPGDGSFTCGVTTGSEAYCWGSTNAGRTGTNSAEGQSLSVPTKVVYGGTAKQISLGDGHGCLLSNEGNVWCWGANGNLQVNPAGPTNQTYYAPVQVAAGRTYSQISVAAHHSCALATDGEVWCWGKNTSGQLGIGTTTGVYTTPQNVIGGSYTQIAAAKLHTCALTATGQAYCWGENSFGQTGVQPPTPGSYDARPTPVLVGGGHTFRQLATFMSGASCGLTTAGALYCWGSYMNGEFGIGPVAISNASQSATPMAAAGGMALASLSVGVNWRATCGVTAAGAAWCWGTDSGDKLGNAGVESQAPTPVQVANPS